MTGHERFGWLEVTMRDVLMRYLSVVAPSGGRPLDEPQGPESGCLKVALSSTPLFTG